MRLAEDMKSITEGIVASHDSRMKEVHDLANTARKTVRGFASFRKHMGAGQSRALAEHTASLRHAAAGMTKGFHKDHAAMAADLKETAETLKANLALGETARMKSFKDMMAGIRDIIKGVEKNVKDIKAHVADKLEEFSDVRAKTGQELRRDLAGCVARIGKETKAVLDETRKQAREFARERALMSAHWQGMASALSKKRGAKAQAKAEPADAPDAPAPDAKPKRKARKKKSRKSA